MSERIKAHTRNGHTNGVASNGHADAETGEKTDGPTAAGAREERDNEGDPYIRLECGRFMPGNRGGPGNPFARHVAAMRAAICAAVPRERLMRIADKVGEMAENGNLAAARLIFRYCGGVPGPTPDPDTLDAQEMEGRRAATVTADDLDLIERKMPASALCVLAHAATPEVRQAWAEDRARREKDAARGGGVTTAEVGGTARSRRAARLGDAAQPAPGQTPGRADGLPDGGDVEETLRGLAGARREGDGRQSLTPSVTKREMKRDTKSVPAGPEVPAEGENGDGRGTDCR